MLPRFVLLPDGGVFAETEVPHASGRFTRLFHETWLRLPANVREMLLELFDECDNSAESLRVFQETGSIVNVRFRVVANFEVKGKGGEFSPDECLCRFSAEVVQTAPEAVCYAVIAHELAHAYLLATGEAEQFKLMQAVGYGTDPDAYRDDPEEIAARKLVESWGFDETAFDLWVKGQP